MPRRSNRRSSTGFGPTTKRHRAQRARLPHDEEGQPPGCPSFLECGFSNPLFLGGSRTPRTKCVQESALQMASQGCAEGFASLDSTASCATCLHWIRAPRVRVRCWLTKPDVCPRRRKKNSPSIFPSPDGSNTTPRKSGRPNWKPPAPRSLPFRPTNSPRSA